LLWHTGGDHCHRGEEDAKVGTAGANFFSIIYLSCSAPNRESGTAAPATKPELTLPKLPERGWKLDESKNEMDGTPETVLSLFNDESSYLMIRCINRRTEVLINPGGELIDDSSVRVKFDDSNPIQQTWNKSSSRNALFSPEPIGFSRRLSKTKLFLFEYSPYDSRPRTIKFSVTGLDSKLGKISEACDWEGSEKRAAISRRNEELRLSQYIHHCNKAWLDASKWCWDDQATWRSGGPFDTKEQAFRDILADERAMGKLGEK
jgi:hypothetical protein